MGSLQFLNSIRSFPDNDIPADKYYKAFEYSKYNMAQFNEGDSPTQWSSIGPNNIGGRTLSLAFSPVDTATLYMGSASGGLWKSTTGGLGAQAWTRIETGYPSLAVSWITIDSVNPNVMYIGTGENYGYQYSLNRVNVRVTRGMYGIGIIKNNQWRFDVVQIIGLVLQQPAGVYGGNNESQNHNVLYAATSEGLYKTNNAGTSYTDS
jgi:hypothetical protein